MNKLVKKLIALLLVVILVSANLVILGEYTIAYAASDEELNDQDSSTSNRYVQFNSYFEGETHSTVFDINSEEAKIYLRLGVESVGYVENGTVEFQNVNFKIKEDIENDNIQSIDTNSNKVVLNQVNNGSEIVVELPIEILNQDNVSTDYFSKEFTVKFTGTYVDDDGNERAVEKELTNKLGWRGTAEAELSAEATKYVPYSTGENSGVMVQTRIKSNVKDSSLPIKNTNIEVTVPTINNQKPTTVTVVATSMNATNGKEDGLEFTNDNYTYDAENGIVTINVDNLSDSIAWKKNVQDEYIVTYLFEGDEMYNFANSNGIDATAEINSRLTLYNNEETIVEGSVTSEIVFEEEDGAITDFSMEAPGDISKGYLYANYDAEDKTETEYNTNYIATITDHRLVTHIDFVQGIDAFVTEDDSEGDTTIGDTNYAYNKRVEVRQDIFGKILGEDGTITLKDGEENEIGVINKDSTLEDGIYKLDISDKDVNELIIEASAPITEGQLEVNVVKALKGNIDYSINQMQSFERLKAKLEGNTDTTTFNVEKDILLKEPETKVDLEISKTDLTTVVKNENVEIRAVLDTSSVYNALFENPTLRFILPSEVENVEVKGANVLLANGLKISNATLSEEDGRKVITIELEGKQTEYAINAEYKGAIIVLNMDITLDTLAASGKEKVRLEYVNDNEVATNPEGAIEKDVNIVAPTGVVAAAGISNYADGAKEIESVSGEAQTVQIDSHADEQTATISGAVINNYQNDISNIVVLGRIPAEANKEIDTDTDLGSTFTMPLSTGIGTSGLSADDYTVYYSDNQNATSDLNNSDNGWSETATTNSKSYLMVFDDEYVMESGDKFEFSYDVNIPADLSVNNSTYSMYKVYYSNNADIGTIEENKVSAILGVATEREANLEVNLSSTADVVREGQYIKMNVSVRNAGETAVNGVVAHVKAPTYVKLQEYVAANGFYNYSGDEMTINIGTIEAGETAEASYFVKIDNNVDVYDSSLEDQLTEEEMQEYLDNLETFPKTTTNVVTVTAEELEGELQSNECVFEIQEGDLTASLTSDIPEAEVMNHGDKIEFKVELVNTTEAPLNDVVVTIPLPEQLSFESGEIRDSLVGDEVITDGISFDESSRVLTINVGTVENKKIIEIVTNVENESGAFLVQAKINGTDMQEHYTEILEFNSEEINLEISELTSTPRYIKESENVTYSFSITNNGDSTVTGITIQDQLPDGIQYVRSEYIQQGSAVNSGIAENNLVTMTIANITAGETITVNIIATAGALPDRNDKEIQNTVTISARGMDAVQTNTVTNIIEYYEGAHASGDPGSSSGNSGYRITGVAWIDENMDGRRDSSEQVVPDIRVILLNKEDNSIVKDASTGEDKITTTSVNGTYQFDNLENGEYLVVFDYDSSNFSLTEYQAEGVDSSMNSDVIDVNMTLDGERKIVGITDTLVVNGENVRDIDIGLYTASRFDLRVDKYIDRIALTTPTIGTRVDEYNNSEVAKVEVAGSNVGRSSAVVEYRIVVTNEGSVPGYVNKIVDYLPDNVDFNTELNTDWYLSDNGNIYNSSLANEVINPGESKEVTLVVSVRITEDVLGTTTNNAEIYESYNELGLQDIDSTVANRIEAEDDMGKADVIFSIVTGRVVMYTSIAFVVVALIGFGAFEIKKHVLNKKV